MLLKIDCFELLPAVGSLHPAGVGVQLAVGAAGGARHAPARLAAVARRLTVLLVRSHHALPIFLDLI